MIREARGLLKISEKYLVVAALLVILSLAFNLAESTVPAFSEEITRSPDRLTVTLNKEPRDFRVDKQFTTARNTEGSAHRPKEISLANGPSAQDASSSTATYTITNNGTHTFAYNEEGQIVFSGVDASSVINSAISSTLLQGGGRIVITQSIAPYKIKSKLKIQGDNLELEGEEGSILMVAADIDSILQVYNEAGGVVKNITITGLIFDGNNTKITNPFCGLIYVLNAENIHIDNIEATNSGLTENYMGKYLVPEAAINARNVRGLWIDNNYVHDTLGSGIIARTLGTGSTNEVYIANNTIVKTNMCNATGGYSAIDIDGENFSITNNYVYRTPFGVAISGNTTKNGYIFGNIFIGNAGADQLSESGIEIWDEGASYIQIKNNYFRRWCYGYGGGGIGIELGNTYSNYSGDGCHHNEIANNIIDSGGYPTNMAAWGITIHGSYNKVHNNTIYNPNPSTDAIKEFSPSQYNEIHDNEILFVGDRMPGDVNGDGIVNLVDLYNISIHWYPGPPKNTSSYDVFADLNYDGLVDKGDLKILSGHWAEAQAAGSSITNLPQLRSGGSHTPSVQSLASTSGPTIFLDPSSIIKDYVLDAGGQIGNKVQASINISETADLYTYNVNVAWNPKMLAFTKIVSYGDFLAGTVSPYGTSRIYDFVKADNKTGSAAISESVIGGYDGVDGNGKLLTIEFLITGYGSTDLALNLTGTLPTQLLNNTGDTLTFTTAACYLRNKLQGDVNGDKTVDILDTPELTAHWYPGPPVGPSGYNRECDIDLDGKVDILDAAKINANWGRTIPDGYIQSHNPVFLYLVDASSTHMPQRRHENEKTL